MRIKSNYTGKDSTKLKNHLIYFFYFPITKKEDILPDYSNDNEVNIEEKITSQEKVKNFVDNIANKVIEKINYIITNTLTGCGTAKEKYEDNISAIKTLKTIESEERMATKEEQEILAKYVGWGGLAEVFDENSQKWSKEYHEMKQVLTPEEYKSARESTLNACSMLVCAHSDSFLQNPYTLPSDSSSSPLPAAFKNAAIQSFDITPSLYRATAMDFIFAP